MNPDKTIANVQACTRELQKLHSIMASAGHGDLLRTSGISLANMASAVYLRKHYVTDKDSPLNPTLAEVVGLACYDDDSPVLITGETGTGKEVIARAFSADGSPFYAINCTGLPDYLVESELFGHRRGSFTGAVMDTDGILANAKNGVVLLDEIGDMPLHLQPKLLRAIQERRVRRIGDTEEREIKCRFITATHRDLGTMIDEGTFREDLYWRLSTFTIQLTPLRTRPMDITAWLAKHWPDVPAPTRELLASSRLEGNYRELQQHAKRYRFRQYMKSSGTVPA